MSTLELALNKLAEATAAELPRVQNPQVARSRRKAVLLPEIPERILNSVQASKDVNLPITTGKEESE